MSAAAEAIPAAPGWALLCQQLAPAAAWVVFFAPFPTIRQVQADKSVGGLPLLPYSSMIVNCFVWITYGVLKSEQSVITANLVGLVLGLYYLFLFRQNCKPTASNLPGTISQHIQGTTIIITFTLLLATVLEKETAAEIIGKEGVVFCIILFASPLAALRDVILTRSAKNIPLPFTVASLINCTLWSVTGVIVMKDFNIYFPNLMGLSCGIAQLALKVVFGDGTGTGTGPSGVELPLTK